MEQEVKPKIGRPRNPDINAQVVGSPEYHRQKYQLNTETLRQKAKDRHVKKQLDRFGLSRWEYDSVQALGLCEICGGQTVKRLSLDHNHETGEFRGFLCGNCNTALGLVQDDPWVLRRMLKYLERTA
jgi:hypothetical protein